MSDEIYKLIDNGDYIHICQGCGKVINLDVDHSDKLIEFVKTHSGNLYFFHKECADRVWGNKIKWMREESRITELDGYMSEVINNG